jgi:hypothetical protein
MTRDDVLTKLREGNVMIEFMKVDGSLRTMRATLDGNQIAYNKPIEGSTTNRKVSDETCPIWDVEENTWKSFRWENLRSVDYIYLPDGII